MALGVFWTGICLILFLAVLSLDMMGVFKRKNQFDVDGRTVVVTGGSQGLGRGLGKLLAKKGANVVIVARNQEKLDAALAYIKAAAVRPDSQRFLAISADVTKNPENERIISEVTTWNNGQPPDIVWANAGSSRPSLFLDADIDLLRAQMDIDYWAATYLAHATLRSWLKPQRRPSEDKSTAPTSPRHFIITSSTLAFISVAGYGPYSPCKAALRSLSDTLRSELNLYNGARRRDPASGPPADVKIHTVFPGTILSPGFENENKTKHPITVQLEEGDPQQTEDEVAEFAIAGLEKGQYLITTNWLGAAMRWGAMSGSPKNAWFVDTVASWVINFAWLFIAPDMEGKVFKYGKTHGMPQHAS